MWATLFGSWLRYVIVAAVTAVASNPNWVQFLGPTVVSFLQQESTITHIVAGIINLGVLSWAARSRIFERLETLKGIARPRTTTVAEVKEEVKAESSKLLGVIPIAVPSKEQMTEAFQTPVAPVLSGSGKETNV